MDRPSRENGKNDSISIFCYICLVVNRISVFVEKP